MQSPPAWVAVAGIIGVALLVVPFLLAPGWALLDAFRRRGNGSEEMTHWIVFLLLSFLVLPAAPVVAIAYLRSARGSDPADRHGRDRRRAVPFVAGMLAAGAVLVVPLTAFVVDEGERLRECHDPTTEDVERVQQVLQQGHVLRESRAVRHGAVRFIAMLPGGSGEAATFGLDGDEVAAVNEEAAAISAAPFDFLFGSGGVIGTDAAGRDTDAGRKAAIRRVEACLDVRLAQR